MIHTLFGAITRPRRLGLALVALGLCGMVAWPAFLTTSASYCRVRVLVATPDVPSVDVQINSIRIASGNKLGEMTPYISRPADHYGLRVFPPGAVEGGNAYVIHDVYLEAGKDWTIVVFGKLADKTLDVSAEEDTNTADSAGARIRFGNYMPGTTTLALKASEGTQSTSVGTANFGRMTAYTPVPPTVQSGTASTLAVTDSNNAGVAQASVRLSANSVITGFAIPSAGGTGTTLLLNLDGGTNKDPLNPASATANAAAASTAAVNGTASALTSGSATASAVLASLPPTHPGLPSPTAIVAPAPAAGESSASAGLRTALAPVPMIANTDTKVFYALTGHTLGGSFKTYWESHGGLEQFGYPITEEYQEVSATDGKTYTTQYFERARFEYHPENAGTPSAVQQGLLGREMLKRLAGV